VRQILKSELAIFSFVYQSSTAQCDMVFGWQLYGVTSAAVTGWLAAKPRALALSAGYK